MSRPDPLIAHRVRMPVKTVARAPGDAFTPARSSARMRIAAARLDAEPRQHPCMFSPNGSRVLLCWALRPLEHRSDTQIPKFRG